MKMLSASFLLIWGVLALLPATCGKRCAAEG